MKDLLKETENAGKICMDKTEAQGVNITELKKLCVFAVKFSKQVGYD